MDKPRWHFTDFSMDKFVIRKRKPTNPIDEQSNNESEDSDLLISSDADYEAGLLLSVEVSKPEKDFGSGSSQTIVQHENKAKRKCGRTFQESWKQKFNWLFYENEKQRAFCGICKAARDDDVPLPTSSKQFASAKCFVEDGFGNWKKALETFQSHEKSDFHRAAVLLTSSKEKQSVSQLISSGHAKQMKENRVALVKIFTSLRYLGRQGLPVRGKVEEESNLMTLLKERADDVVELHEWLRRKEKFKWLSPEITSEILKTFSHAILQQLKDEVMTINAGYYGIILDETSDVANKEQISICFRVVQENFLIEELFFGFYQTSITSSDVIYAIVKDVLLRFQFAINKCRGQCYDGAANVSGHISGLRTRILKDESRATYVHCRAHKLNLAVQDAMKNNKEIRDMLNLIRELIAFIRGSPKRLAWFSQFNESDRFNGAGKSLRPFCPTRWTMRLVSLEAICSNYIAIFNWLKDVDATEKNDSGAKASGFLKSLSSFNTFFLIEVLRMVFTIVEGGSSDLQGKQLSFSKSEEVIKCIKESVSNARNEDHFSNIWHASQSVLPLTDLIEEPQLPRQQIIPRRLDDEAGVPFVPSTPQEFYRIKYFTILDSVLVGLTERFEPDETSQHLTQVEDFLLGKEVEANYIVQHYREDVNGPRLKLHRDMLVDKASGDNEVLEDFQSIVAFLSKNATFRGIITEVSSLIRIILTLPVSSCSAERSFSGLRRLKTYLRSRMTQERLNAVVLMNTHKDILGCLDIDKLVDNFISKSSVRKNTFMLSK